MFGLRRRKAAGVLGLKTTGQSCTAAVVTRHPGARPRLRYCARTTLGGGTDGMQGWLRTLRREAGTAPLTVAASLEPGRYAMALIELPVMPEAERRQAARWRIRDVLDFDVDEAVVDVAEVPTPDGPSARRYFAFAAQASVVEEFRTTCRAAGFRPARLGVPEFALRNLAAELPEDRAGLALVYFDTDSMIVVVTREQSLCVARRIESEVLACVHASGADDKQQQALVEVLVLEILRTLDFYESRFRAPAVTAVVFVPAPGLAPGVLAAVEEQLEVACRLLDLASILDLDRSIDTDQVGQCALAIGNALLDIGARA